MSEISSNSVETNKPDVVSSSPQGVELLASMMAYYGSVPPPEMVEAYERLCPGATNRFIQIAEHEQQRRTDNDRAVSNLAVIQEENSKINYRWGLVSSCGLMALYLIIMFLCVLLNAPSQFLVAMLGVPALSAVAAIVTQFMLKSSSTKS
jgi:uncharacterized membrane protein